MVGPRRRIRREAGTRIWGRHGRVRRRPRLFGGFDGDGAARNDLHLFNTTSHAWRAAPPPSNGLLPAPRGHAPFAASYAHGTRPAYGGFVDDVLYVFGGSSRAVDAGVSHRQAAMALSEDTWMVNVAQLRRRCLR